MSSYRPNDRRYVPSYRKLRRPTRRMIRAWQTIEREART